MKLPIHYFNAGDPVRVVVRVSKSEKHLEYDGRYGVVDTVLPKSGVVVRFDAHTTKLFFPNDVRIITEEEIRANSGVINIARRAWEKRYGRQS